MSSTLTPKQLDTYRQTMRRRAVEADRRQAERRETAWAVAREAAALLRSRYGATQVLASVHSPRAGISASAQTSTSPPRVSAPAITSLPWVAS